ncbi:3-hydroxyacyl-CoA dehydrogenase NAD-binding domain-containing protein [Allokutzneria sp. A3M-2-11 16]|uniref:3-hydroxyacyl-CoA dehydrogenase family protein n=1 Tax=Allokutzneria sp. A3M-2-11 16 TaxID=2962043 RepID=UPI0020B6D17D|nr:3-hydroxyacyl-CoA dehydrogenase NAD-binding domain-containing protein [Allokutzneria sp. A3M-2-11 16]MCP3804696.1 3-hydroxyacyl-CoA dehydrogenase NAD-binding domain-containing protein [Allokutzneria sp. A3M-2-11 16]
MSLVGVVGAGVMGSGVAQTFAQAGHEIVLIDNDPEALAKAVNAIELNARMSRMMGGPAVDHEAVLARITTGTDLGLLAEAHIVIENVTENWEIKKAVWAELEATCKAETIFVANTSAIPITKLASLTKRPAQVAGVHFMNPVPMKPAAELIKGYHTTPETIETVRDLLTSAGKRGIDVNDASGFVSNRVLMLTVNEAAYLVYEGVASAETVDDVFRSCFGHPMGPLETADLIGVDTILYSVEVLHEHFADSKYRPCPLLKQMTDAGLHGRKSGKGFYTY